jgi:hypothetical protein
MSQFHPIQIQTMKSAKFTHIGIHIQPIWLNSTSITSNQTVGAHTHYTYYYIQLEGQGNGNE